MAPMDSGLWPVPCPRGFQGRVVRPGQGCREPRWDGRDQVDANVLDRYIAVKRGTVRGAGPSTLVSRTRGRTAVGLRFAREEWADSHSTDKPRHLIAMHGMGGSPHNWD